MDACESGYHRGLTPVLVLRGLGHGLDEQATEVARQLKFSPATRSGKPIPYWKKLSVEFNLR